MMKRFIVCLISAALALCFGGCALSSGTVGEAQRVTEQSSSSQGESLPVLQMPNPISQVESPEEFSPLGFEIKAPDDAKDVTYSTISGKTAQARFTLDEKEYVYRAAKSMKWQMLSGVYEEFEEKSLSFEVSGKSFSVSATVYTIKGGGKLAWWQSGEITYTLYTGGRASDGDMLALIMKLAEN